MTPLRLSVALATLSVVVPRVTNGETIRVPADYATIQLALDVAAPGDVVLVAPGTFTDTETRPVMTRGGNVVEARSVGFLPPGVTLRSEAGAEVTILQIDADGDALRWTLVALSAAEDPVTIEGFTLRGGRFGSAGLILALLSLHEKTGARRDRRLSVRGSGGGGLPGLVRSRRRNPRLSRIS